MKAINKWFRSSLKGDTDDIQVDKRSSKQDFQKRSSSCSQQDVLVRQSSLKHDDKKRRSKHDNRKRSYSQGEDHEKDTRISSVKDKDKLETLVSQNEEQMETSQFQNEDKMDKSQLDQNGQIISPASQHEDKTITLSYQNDSQIVKSPPKNDDQVITPSSQLKPKGSPTPKNDNQVITPSPQLKPKGSPTPKSDESVGTLPSKIKVHQNMSMSQYDDHSPQQKDGNRPSSESQKEGQLTASQSQPKNGNIPSSEYRNEGQLTASPSQLEDEISALLSQIDADIDTYINDDQIGSSSSQSNDKISTSSALIDTKSNPPPILQNNITKLPSQHESQVKVLGDQLQEDFLAFENVNEETHFYEKVNSNLDKNISEKNDKISMNQEIPFKSPIPTSSKVSSSQEKISNSKSENQNEHIEYSEKLNNEETSKSTGINVSRKTSHIPKMIPTKSAIPRLVATESSAIPKQLETTLIPRMITSQQVAKSLPKKSRIPSHIQKKSTHSPPTIPRNSEMKATENSSVLPNDPISEKKNRTETKSEAILSEKKEMTMTDTKSNKMPQKQNKTPNIKSSAISTSENKNALQKDPIFEKKDTTEIKSKSSLPPNKDEDSNSSENTSMTRETETAHTMTKSSQLQKQNKTSTPHMNSRSMTAPETSLKTYSSSNNISTQPSSIPKLTRRMTLTGSISPQRKSASTKEKKTEEPSRKMPPRSKTFQLMTFKSRKSASSGTPPQERTPKRTSSNSSTLPRPKTTNTSASTSSKLPTAAQIIPNSEQHFNKVLHENWHPFLKFLKQEYSEENFYFWSACEKYNSTIDPGERLRIAQAIVKRHLIEDAIQHVNIDAVQSRTIQEAVEAAANGDPIDEKLLIKAQKRVYNLMKSDSFTRYLKSELYNNAEENSKNKKVETKESVQKRKTKLPFSNKKKRTSPLNRLSLSFT